MSIPAADTTNLSINIDCNVPLGTKKEAGEKREQTKAREKERFGA